MFYGMVKRDQEDVSVLIKLRDATTGAPITGVTLTDLDYQYFAIGGPGQTDESKVYEATGNITALANQLAAHTDWGMAEVGGGTYRLDLADALWDDDTNGIYSYAQVQIWDAASSTVLQAELDFQIVDFDPANLKAEINAEVDTALSDIKLDHLVAVADADDVVNDSIMAKLVSKDATADWSDFNNTTDSLEAIRDHADTIKSETALIVGDTNELQTDWTDGGRLDLIIDLILADTAELQTDWTDGGRLDLILDDVLLDTGTTIPNALTTIDNFLDTEIADVLADTVELQTDWTNGGRLDLILDAILADTATLPGAGDRAFTLTVRDTGSVALEDVTVWLGPTSTRTNVTVGATNTNASGQIVFNLDDATYYVFCFKSGYTFADGSSASATSITVSAGNTSETLDIATAVTAPTDNSSTENFLTRMMTSVRRYVDEPTTNEKYTDAILIDEIEKSYPIVIAEINRNKRDDIVVARFTVSVTNAASTNVLPYHIGRIVAIYEEDDESGSRIFYLGRGKLNTAGRGLWVEGNTIKVQKGFFNESKTMTVEYIPTATARLHRGECTLDADGDAATFGAVPIAGTLDTHTNAYAGSILRILSASTNGYLQERTITAYDNTTRIATLDAVLSPIPTGTINYEIAAPISRGLDDVIASYLAWVVASVEGSSRRADSILKTYRDRIRNLRLSAFYSNYQSAVSLKDDAYDSSKRHRSYRGRW